MIYCQTRMRPKDSMLNMNQRKYWDGRWFRIFEIRCLTFLNIIFHFGIEATSSRLFRFELLDLFFFFCRANLVGRIKASLSNQFFFCIFSSVVQGVSARIINVFKARQCDTSHVVLIADYDSFVRCRFNVLCIE